MAKEIAKSLLDIEEYHYHQMIYLHGVQVLNHQFIAITE